MASSRVVQRLRPQLHDGDRVEQDCEAREHEGKRDGAGATAAALLGAENDTLAFMLRGHVYLMPSTRRTANRRKRYSTEKAKSLRAADCAAVPRRLRQTSIASAKNKPPSTLARIP